MTVDKYLCTSNLINHLAVKTMDHNVLFTNKKKRRSMSGCLRVTTMLLAVVRRAVKTDVCISISIQIPAKLIIYELYECLHRIPVSFLVKMKYYLL